MNAVIFRLWRLSTASSLVSWLATKTFISALYMNDTMLVTGDNSPMCCTAQWGYAFTKHGVKKYLITPSVFKLQKWFLHQNGI